VSFERRSGGASKLLKELWLVFKEMMMNCTVRALPRCWGMIFMFREKVFMIMMFLTLSGGPPHAHVLGAKHSWRAKSAPMADDVQEARQGRIICLAFRNTGICRFGDACRFLHEAGDPISALPSWFVGVCLLSFVCTLTWACRERR
jgi:hypothetical protein